MSVYSNRFNIFVYGETTRILFEDCVQGKDGVIVSNVVMPTVDAEQLAEVLATQIKLSKGKKL